MIRQETEICLEQAGENGYDWYKVPGISMNEAGTMFCYYEGRREKNGVLEDKALFYRIDRQGTLSERLIVSEGREVHNISLLGGCRNEVHLFWCEDYKRCFYKKSEDGGEHWENMIDLTPLFEAKKAEYPWNFMSISNGHGIQIKSGRLLIPAWMSSGAAAHRPACLVSLYSDDQGINWSLGDIFDGEDILPDPTECSIAQRGDGTVLATIRHNNQFHYRGFAVSQNMGVTFENAYLDSVLPDPICSAGLCRIGFQKNAELFALTNCTYFNEGDKPEPDSRKNLTLHLSKDGGKIWSAHVLLEERGGYSDLIYCRETDKIKIICEKDWAENDCFHPAKIVLKSIQIT